MKKYNLACKLRAFIIGVIIMCAGNGLANTNIVWDFSNPADYDHSHSSFTEVDGTNAQLTLQAQTIYMNHLTNYVNSSSASLLELANDASLQLSGAPGSFASHGQYISRVLDGGNVGNEWEMLRLNIDGSGMKNSLKQITPPYSGLVGLWHLNNDMLDYSGSGNHGTAPIMFDWETDVPFGAAGAYFNPASKPYMQTSSGVAVSGAMSISVWVRPDEEIFDSLINHIISSEGGSYGNINLLVSGTYSVGGHRKNSIGFWINNQYTTVSSTLEDSFNKAENVNVWRHIVATYDASRPARTMIYVDAVPLSIYQQNVTGTINAQSYLIIGRRKDGSWPWRGDIDEIAIFDRALTDDEVRKLYENSQPAMVQIRSSSESDPTGPFVGPDGTSNTFFVASAPLQTIGGFVVTNRHVQYSLEFYGSASQDLSPIISSVSITGSDSEQFDNIAYDFSRGMSSVDIDYSPSEKPTPYIGLAVQNNGGYPTNGIYTSRLLDGGTDTADWSSIAWVEGGEHILSAPGMVGLYYMDDSDSPTDNVGPFAASGNNLWTGDDAALYPKIGSGSAVFSGAQQINYNFPSITAVRSVEFWVYSFSPDGGLIEITTTETNGIGATLSAYVSLDNRQVNVTGMEAVGKHAQVFVNASPYQSGLLSGWNHVALVFDSALKASGFKVGTANGQFLEGMLDELVLYSKELAGGEIASHFVSGRYTMAGAVDHVEVCTGDTLPLSDVFSGSYDSGDAINITARYLKYRLVLAGDGSGTPAVESVTVNYDSSSYVDDTADEINQGTFNGTAWYGDEINLLDQAQVEAEVDDATAKGIWHMDDSWGSGSAFEAVFGSDPRMGSACGQLDGVNDFITLGSHNLNSGPFAVSIWFNSKSPNRAPVMSARDTSGAWLIELNGDGSGGLALGQVSFSVDDDAAYPPFDHRLVSARTGLNDGKWHNIIGLRDGEQIHLYIDGERDASVICGAGFGDVGAGQTYVGTTNSAAFEFYKGKVDEIAIWNRALTEAEVGNYYSGGYRTKGEGVYISEVLDNNGDPSIWKDLSWVADGAYGQAMEDGGSPSLIALWHFDDLSFACEVDAANDGTGVGTPTINTAGRFASCLDLGAGDSVTIDSAVLNPATAVSLEAWVKMTSVGSKVVFDKHDGVNDGYILATDATGNPTFRVDDAMVTSYLPVRAGKWTHLAGTYDGAKLRLYMDGQVVASVAAGGKTPIAAPVETGIIGAGSFDGLIDEMAIHERALPAGEILGHYKAGALTLKFQAQTDAQPYVGPGGSTATYWTDSRGVNMQGSVNLGVNFTYKAILDSEDHRMTPHLHGTRVYVANYPVNNPQVYPINGTYTPGRLYGFTQTIHRISSNADVRYQISWNNGLNYYYWVGGTNNVWAPATLGDYADTSDAATINNNINKLYDQLVEPNKSGVNLKVKSYLHSDGAYQIQLDDITIPASKGRLLVTVPNGTENGIASWIVNVPQVIKWTTDGTVSDNLTIELWNNSGSLFIKDLATNYANCGSWTGVVHNLAAADYRIKIRDVSDDTIYDASDGNFELRYGYHLISPNGGELWKIGETNNLVWQHPPTLNATVDFWFSYDGLSNDVAWTKMAAAQNVPNPAGAENSIPWLGPTNDWRFVSEKAMIAVVSHNLPKPLSGGLAYALSSITTRDFSDAVFTNAGIAIIYPEAGAGIQNGITTNVTWAAAGVGNGGVKIELYDGFSWSTVVSNAPCVAGTNNKALVTFVGQTEEALIRITSIEKPDLVGVSYAFTLADIDLIDPFGGLGSRSLWEIGTTNYIHWTSGGAGTNVHVMYTCNEISNKWVFIASNYPNINSTVITNELPWIIPGPPSDSVKVKILSPTQAGLSVVSDPAGFSMMGLELVLPNRDSIWPFTGNSNKVQWLNVGGNGDVTVDVSYDSGSTWEFVTNAYSQNALVNTIDVMYGQLRRPSERSRIRLTQAATELGHPFVEYMSQNYQIKGIAMHSPSNGLTLNLGSNIVDILQWYSTKTGAGEVQLYYSANNGATYLDEIKRTGGLPFSNTDDGDSWNSYAWPISRKLRPSLTAKVKVVTATGYSAETKAFTMRGVRIVVPTGAAKVDIGSTVPVSWDYADVDGNAQGSNYVSVTGIGGPFTKQGFTNNAQLNFGGVDWIIPTDIEPTTNAVIMMDIFDPPADADVYSYSQPFTIAGIKIKSPNTGTNWWGGTQNQIRFTAAGLNVGARADIYYAADGVTFDMAKPIVPNLSVGNGDNVYNWNIENSSALTRQPSTNARIRVVSGIYSGKSQPFTLSGIKVTKPKSGDVWAVKDGTNTIEWTGVNIAGNYDISFTVLAGSNPLLTYPHTESIASGVAPSGINNSFDWPMVSNSIGSDVIVTVKGAGYTNNSEHFEIVAQPSVRFANPLPGDFLKVTSTSMVQWVRGGNMANDFELWVTYSDNSSSRLGTSAGGDISLANGIFSYEWRDIPNRLGITSLTATNKTDTSVFDTVTNFNIAPTFVIPPFSANLYALKEYKVYFTTKGSVGTGVDLFYTTDDMRDPASWVHINKDTPFPVAHNETLFYPWKVADARDSSVYLRIQDHSYTQRFDIADAGPFDDYGPFEIAYYRVAWEVYDAEIYDQAVYNPTNLANATLKSLSMSDNLGYSVAGIPIAGWTKGVPPIPTPYVRYYPYGEWDTLWFKEFFHDQAVLGWVPSEGLTNVVIMERSKIEPDYNVMANFTFESATTNFVMNSWLERGGAITEGATNCTIRIYDAQGNWITDRSSTTPNNGVFWQNWNVTGLGFDATDVFFARVEIMYSGAKYSSGLTFVMRQALILDEIGETISVKSSFTYSSALTNFAVYAWLERGGLILNSSSNCNVTITDAGNGVTIASLSTNGHANGVFRQIWAVPAGYDDTDVFFGRVEIEYLKKTYSAGQTFMMRLAATDAITNMMADVSSILTDVGSLTGSLANVSGNIDYIRNTGIPGINSNIGAMSNRLENAITSAKDDIIVAVATNTAMLGTISTDMSTLTGAVVGVIGPTITSIWDEVTQMSTNVASDVSRILTRPTTVLNGSTIKILYKTRPNLVGVNISVTPGGYSAGMTPIIAGSGIYERDVTFNFGPGSYVVTCVDPYASDSMIIEATLTATDEALGMIAGVSNRLNAVAADVASLSGLSALTNSMNALEDVVSNLTGLNTDDIMTGLDDIVTKLTSIKSDVTSIDTASIESGVNEMKSGLTEVKSGMTEVKSGMSEIKSSVASLDFSQLDQIVNVANQLGQIGSDSSTAAQNSQQAKTAAQEASTGIQDLKEALAVDDVDESLKAIGEIRQALMNAQQSITTMTDTLGLSMGGRLSEMMKMLKELAESKGFEGITTATEKAVGGEGGEGADIGDLNKTLQETKGKMVHMEKLLEEAAYEPLITEMLIGEK